METENSQNMFSVSITHNSKIRELNDGNRVMNFPYNLFAIGPTIFELWVMEIEIWVMEIAKPNTPLVFFFLKKKFRKYFPYFWVVWALENVGQRKTIFHWAEKILLLRRKTFSAIFKFKKT